MTGEGVLRWSGLLWMVVLLPFLPTGADGQVWSKPFHPGNMPTVEVQWRVYGLDTRTHKNVFEWLFLNVGDSSISFNYRVETNRKENRTGRLSLNPGKRVLSGWLFEGDTLTVIALDHMPFGRDD